MPKIIGVNVALSSYVEVAAYSVRWAREHKGRAIFFGNVHMLMEAHDDPTFRSELNDADLINPDGMPLVWALRASGERRATRVYGPDATEVILGAAQDSGVPVGFYGGSEETLATLLTEVRRRYPELRIVYTMSPPFRALNQAEDDEIITRILDSGAEMLFVGLGCPKQERWIMQRRDSLPIVMLGVGAAFDFLAGSKPQAPRWMMRNGLEWMFRLVSEPRRLAGRYFKHNPRFVMLFLHQWLTEQKSRP